MKICAIITPITPSVEEYHSGTEPSVVLYIPVGPDCLLNRLYAARMRTNFLLGLSPPDFASAPRNEIDFKDRANLKNLGDDAKKMMGFQSN